MVIWIHNRTEPFEGVTKNPIPTIDKELAHNYNIFVTQIYNPFMNVWKKSIISAASAETIQQPLTDPSQTSTASAPIPSDADLNEYITNLSQQKGHELPRITKPLPETIDLANFPAIAPLIPMDPAPYQHALDWMNEHMKAAHENLQAALRGEGFKNLEGFDNQTCQDLSQCFRDNPELIKQCGLAIQEQQKKDQGQINKQIKQFIENKKLQESIKLNRELVAESQKVQDQAQSGDLINQLNLPSEPETKYELPEGSDKMNHFTPEKHREVQQAAPAMYSLKGLLNQINGNLR